DGLPRGALRGASKSGGGGDRPLRPPHPGQPRRARLSVLPGTPQPRGTAPLLPLRAVRRRGGAGRAPKQSPLRAVRAARPVPHHREPHPARLDDAGLPGDVRAASLTVDLPEAAAELAESLLWDAGATGLEIRDRDAPPMPGVRGPGPGEAVGGAWFAGRGPGEAALGLLRGRRERAGFAPTGGGRGPRGGAGRGGRGPAPRGGAGWGGARRGTPPPPMPWRSPSSRRWPSAPETIPAPRCAWPPSTRSAPGIPAR